MNPGEKEICILLPTLNEEKGIGRMIDSIRQVSKGKWRIIVVDSMSVDKTAEIARSMGAEILSVPMRGKGRAVKVAFEKIDSDFLVMIDADYSYSVDDIPSVLKAMESADVAIGSRFAGKIEEGAMSRVNRFGNRALTAFANILYGKRTSDVCSGLWGFTKKAYKSMEITAPHFELEANFYAEAARLGLKIVEVPILYRARLGEKKLGVMHGMDIALFLAKKRLWKQPRSSNLENKETAVR